MSRLTTGYSTNLKDLIAALEARGYARSASTKSLVKYLADTATSLTGTTVSEKTTGRAALFALIKNALDGGSQSASTSVVDELVSEGYVAVGVHLDGTFWALLDGNLVTADSPYYSFSGWVRLLTYPAEGGFMMFYDISPPGAESGPYVSSDRSIGFEAFNPDTGFGMSVETSTAIFGADAMWKHLFGWLDNTAGQQAGKIYLDGVDVTNTVQFDAPQSFPFAGKEFDLPDNTIASDAPKLAMDMADWWIAPGVLETDVTKFRDPVSGRPKNPANFPAAAFLLTGDKDHFLLNPTGSEGALTVQAGSLTNASTSPSRYQFKAVHFDGATFLRNAALASPDSPYVAWSGWFRYAAGADTYDAVWVSNPDIYDNGFYVDPGDQTVGVFFANSDAGATPYGFTPTNGTIVPGGWLHMLIAGDTSTGKFKVYVNDVDLTPVINPNAAFNMLYNARSLYIANDGGTSFYTGDMADFWWVSGVNLLDTSSPPTIPVATRRRFITADGAPVDPVNFPSSAVLLTGGLGHFDQNQGSGGAFTVTGSLTAS